MFSLKIGENANEFEYSFCESEINLKENNIQLSQAFQDFLNNNNFINEEEKDLKENENMEYYHYYLLDKQENGNNILEKKEKLTFFKLNTNKEESKENKEPIYYSINAIINILSDDKFIKIRNKILSNKNFNFIPNEIEFSKEKKKYFGNDDKNLYILIENKKEDNKLKLKRGRKTNKINNIKEHSKMCPDNIIKKIKAKLFQYVIDSINNLLNKKENILLKLDYRFINRLNREQDLKYLKMTLKDLLSKDISPKYFPISGKDYNKNKIEYILKYEANDTIKFIFSITLADWLDIFTLKKTVRQIVEKYDCFEENIDYAKIKKSFIGIEQLLNKISDNNSEEYFTLFVFYIYNYERWFYIKHGRSRSPK